MPSEKFIMVSLDDEKSKDLANVISNDTSRRLLAYLSEKEASESDIAKSLGLPLSTVHYNIQNLLKSNLIEIKDFYWSGKGNKVNIYTIAKKFIVIAPKGSKVPSAIKSLIPVALISLAATALIAFVSRNSAQNFAASIPMPAKEVAIEQSVSTGTSIASKLSFLPGYAFWFLAGSLFAIIIYLLIYMFRRKK